MLLCFYCQRNNIKREENDCLMVLWLVAELELNPSLSEIQIQAAFAQLVSQRPGADVEQLPSMMVPQHDDTALDFPTDCPSHCYPSQGLSANHSETLTQRLEEDRVL